MKKLKTITVGLVLTVMFSGCTIITRGQEDILRDHAQQAELRAETNERQIQLLEETLGSDSPVLLILESESEWHKHTAELIYGTVGRESE